MLGMPGLVEERAPVVGPAHRLDDEHDLARHLDRRAERAGRLVRSLLDVEVDVLLRVQVDAEVLQRRLERGQHPSAGNTESHFGGAEDARDVPALRLGEADAGAGAQKPVRSVFVERLRRVEERAALRGEVVELVVELVVQLAVGLGSELASSPRASPGVTRAGAGSGAPRSARCERVRSARGGRGRRCSRSPAATCGTGSPRRRRSSSASPRASPSAPRACASARRGSPRRRSAPARSS